MEHGVRTRADNEDGGLEAQVGRGANDVTCTRAPPPFYDWDATELDRIEQKARSKRSKGSGGVGGGDGARAADSQGQGGGSIGITEVVDVAKEGYAARRRG